jgi:hypothetical protein
MNDEKHVSELQLEQCQQPAILLPTEQSLWNLPLERESRWVFEKNLSYLRLLEQEFSSPQP